MNENEAKQLIITESNSHLYINERNIESAEELMDMLLKGTATAIRTILPQSLIKDFLPIYTDSLKELMDDFDNCFKSDLDNQNAIKESQNIDNQTFNLQGIEITDLTKLKDLSATDINEIGDIVKKVLTGDYDCFEDDEKENNDDKPIKFND